MAYLIVADPDQVRLVWARPLYLSAAGNTGQVDDLFRSEIISAAPWEQTTLGITSTWFRTPAFPSGLRYPWNSITHLPFFPGG
jgi:hypothetical protein